MRIPISLKVIFLVVSLLVATTAYFANQSSKEFAQVLTIREEYEITRQTQARSKEVEGILQQMIQRTSSLGKLALASKTDLLSPSSLSSFDVGFESEVGLVALELYQVEGSLHKSLLHRIRDTYQKDGTFTLADLRKIRSVYPVAVRSILHQKIEIQNSSLPHGIPILTMGIPVSMDENGKVTHFLIADFELGLLQKAFLDTMDRTRVSFLTDQNGYLIAHANETYAIQRFNMKENPLFQKSMDPLAASNLQTQFIDPATGIEYIGAYSKTSNKFFEVITVTQAEKSKVLEPAANVKREAIRIAGQVIAVAFFVSFLFALSLTSPIEKLAELISVVSKGNFNVRARALVHSQDEVGDLAIAFDRMTDGLRERDKMKSLFSKFHGSSITEDLLKNNVGRRGTRRQVTVFFSDIRGFTSFSEKHQPEEVVDMLNEYFAVMVSIINKHNGVVDKFIGDAIMAVWGVPKGFPNDTEMAVRACLEMRKALVDLNDQRKSRGKPEIMIGMGLHQGQAISGTIGSDERMEYTVIGDTVNMTSRIEASTKAFGTDFLISESIAESMGEKIRSEFAGLAEAKGKSEPMKLYKVWAIQNSDKTWNEVITEYSQYEAEKSEKIKVA